MVICFDRAEEEELTVDVWVWATISFPGIYWIYFIAKQEQIFIQSQPTIYRKQMKAKEHNPYCPNLNKKYYIYYSKATECKELFY